MRPTALALLLCPAVALAGMPSYVLSQGASWRLEAISFFLALLGAVVVAVRVLWGRLRGDFPRLPAPGWGSSLGLVLLWGLGFHLVLAMIAGGRELMTPGAWERTGATHRLAGPPPPDAVLAREARRQRLEELRAALWAYAEAHGRQFPPDDFSPGVPEERWRVAGGSGLHFIYVGGARVDTPGRPLAYEPGLFGRERLVLFADGDIRALPLEAIHTALEGRP